MSKEHEPLQQVRRSLTIPWYRCPIERTRLKDLTSRSDLRGALQTLGHLVLAAATAFATYYLFDQRIWVGFALLLFAHGTVCSFLPGLATHELSHGTVFRTRWLNNFFLRLLSLLFLSNYHDYKMSHTYHHLYTLYPRGDREVVLPSSPNLNPFFLLQLFTLNIFGGRGEPYSWAMVRVLGGTLRLAFTGKPDKEWLEAVYADQRQALRKSVTWARVTVLFHLALIAVSIVFGLWLLPVLVTFAPFFANWLRYFVSVPMHTGLRDNVADFRKCVRTITLDPFTSFLYWRMNWHTEHHMFAAVPCYNLVRLHREVAFDMPKPRTLAGAWREMRETWKRQQHDPGYQFDTPISDKRVDRPAGSDVLESSLGDLDPRKPD